MPFIRPSDRNGRSGESLVEACLAIGLICLIFMGLFQVSLIIAARETLAHAAASGNRARTVGFNRWMVEKSVLAASIPNAGRLLEPPFENVAPLLRAEVAGQRPGSLWSRVLAGDVWPTFAQVRLELARLPQFMESENGARARYILDYSDWDTVRMAPSDDGTGPLLDLRVRQNYRLWVPMTRAFYAADAVPLEGESRMENHFPLYIEDRGW
jgi:hypothetical protein